jgi:ribosomal protein S18 acetylase RimI-like enzyme
MTPRPFTTSDGIRIREFLERMPETDRNFFKEDLDGETVAGWLRDSETRRALLADDAGRVLAYVAVIPGIGWSGHVGELRLVVDPAARRQGLGRQMARWGLTEAVRMSLTKIFVELVADQEAAVAMFQDLGFVGEALLTDHVRDRRGVSRDLIVLAHHVGENATSLAATGLDDIQGTPTPH